MFLNNFFDFERMNDFLKININVNKFDIFLVMIGN